MKKKNILILGSDGYLGTNLVSKIDENIFSIDKYDIFPKSKDTNKLDLKDIEKIEKIIKNKNYDVILSLAGVLPGKYPKKLLYKENLSAVNFLKSLNTSSHFIFCSSTAVYKNKKFDKESIEEPFEIYGKSKLDCEAVIRQNTKSHTIFRIGTMLSKNRLGGIMNLLERIKVGKLIWLPYGGKVVHPFIDVDDVVKAILYTCIEKVNGTFDLIGNNRETIYDLAVQLKPNQKIISLKFIDWIIKYIGFDNFPILGISKWHLNALKYDLPISKKENIWRFTQIKNMNEAVKNSVNY